MTCWLWIIDSTQRFGPERILNPASTTPRWRAATIITGQTRNGFYISAISYRLFSCQEGVSPSDSFFRRPLPVPCTNETLAGGP
jgi:hypothetical protein